MTADGYLFAGILAGILTGAALLLHEAVPEIREWIRGRWP